MEDNSTYLLCGNGSIRNPEMEINYRTLQLHQGIIKVYHTCPIGISTWCSTAVMATVCCIVSLHGGFFLYYTEHFCEKAGTLR